jgi:hypothetical protein
MFSAILALLTMPFTDLSKLRGIQFRPLSKIAFFIFVANFLILMQLGAKHVESPFIELGQVCTVLYFAHFLIIVPFISLLENTLIDLSTKHAISRLQNGDFIEQGLRKVLNIHKSGCIVRSFHEGRVGKSQKKHKPLGPLPKPPVFKPSNVVAKRRPVKVNIGKPHLPETRFRLRLPKIRIPVWLCLPKIRIPVWLL